MNKFLCFLFFVLFSCGICVAQEIDASNEKTLPYNYLDTESVAINLSIVEPISTKKSLYEGQIIKFKVLRDVYYQGVCIVCKGEIAEARVETIITSGMNGFPAEIILGNFNIQNLCNSKLIDSYTKKGSNRCLWVYPLKWALTPIPFVGSFTNLIKGGHAKIKTTDVITLRYYPNWK